MEEPTIIDKLEKDPTEIPENPNLEIPKEKNVWGFIWILVVLVIIFPAVAFAYLYLAGKLDPFIEKYFGDKDNEEEKVAEEDELTWNEWTGEYIKANLPEGWEIDETSIDGFIGFAGFNLSKDGTVLFEISPQSGIGFGACSCTEYFSYPDTKSNAASEIEQLYSADTENICEDDYIQEIKISEYETANLLGTEVRISNGVIFFDRSEDGSSFNAGCGEMRYEFDLTDDENNLELGWMIAPMTSDSGINNSYWMSVKKYPDESDNEVVAEILSSIGIVKEFDWVGYQESTSTEADWNTYTNDTYNYSLKYPSDWTIDIDNADLTEADGADIATLEIHFGLDKFVLSKWITGRGGQYCDFTDAPAPDELGGGGETILGDGTFVDNLENYRRNEDGIETSDGYYYLVCKKNESEGETFYLGYSDLGEITYYLENESADVLEKMDEIFNSIELL